MREYCKPFYSERMVQSATKKTRLEKLLLFFIRKQFSIDKETGNALVFKRLGKKIFILDFIIDRPVHFGCRHKIIYG